MEKRLRSNEIGQQGCYFIRRLANNLGEPQRSYAINAIDRALKFWKAKRVRKPVPLRAPWLSGYELDTQPSTTSHHPRPRDQAVQHYTPDSFYRHCIYQISVGYGQPLQSQRSSQSVGRRRNPSLVHAPALRQHSLSPHQATINTSLSMEMHYDSPTHRSHLLPQAHFRTRSSHRPRKSISLSVPL